MSHSRRRFCETQSPDGSVSVAGGMCRRIRNVPAASAGFEEGFLSQIPLRRLVALGDGEQRDSSVLPALRQDWRRSVGNHLFR